MIYECLLAMRVEGNEKLAMIIVSTTARILGFFWSARARPRNYGGKPPQPISISFQQGSESAGCVLLLLFYLIKKSKSEAGIIELVLNFLYGCSGLLGEFADDTFDILQMPPQRKSQIIGLQRQGANALIKSS